MNAIEACISESAVPDPCLRLVFLTFRCLWSSITCVQWNELQLKALAISTAQLLQILDSELHAGRIVESDISPELGNLQKWETASLHCALADFSRKDHRGYQLLRRERVAL